MRFLYAFLLVPLWLVILGAVVTVAPWLPWYAWLFAVVFVVLWRRRRALRNGDGEPLEGLAGSPTITRRGF